MGLKLTRDFEQCFKLNLIVLGPSWVGFISRVWVWFVWMSVLLFGGSLCAVHTVHLPARFSHLSRLYYGKAAGALLVCDQQDDNSIKSLLR